MLTRKIILIFCLICIAFFASRAQQTVPPPPKPADDGPSLQLTMKFIQDKLNDVGRLRWTVTARNIDTGDEQVTVRTAELANAVADAQRCAISYYSVVSFGSVGPRGEQPASATPTAGAGPRLVVNLKEVKKVMVKSAEEGWTANAGNTTRTLSQPIFEIVVQQSRNRSNAFYVDDEELANRLARAMTHAVELCTPDKKAEPF